MFMGRPFTRIHRFITRLIQQARSWPRAQFRSESAWLSARRGAAVGVGAVAGAAVTSTSTETIISTAIPISMAAIAPTSAVIEVVVIPGNTTRSTAAALPTETAEPQIDSAARRVVIHWPTASELRSEISAGKAAISAALTARGVSVIAAVSVIVVAPVIAAA